MAIITGSKNNNNVENLLISQPPVLQEDNSVEKKTGLKKIEFSKAHPKLYQCEVAILTAEVANENLPVIFPEVDTVFKRETHVFKNHEQYTNPELAREIVKVVDLELVNYFNNPYLRKDDESFKENFHKLGFSVICKDKVFAHHHFPAWVIKGNTSQVSCIENKAGKTGNNKFDHINRPYMADVIRLAAKEENLPFTVPEIYLIKTPYETLDPEAQFIVVQRRIIPKSHQKMVEIFSSMPRKEQEYYARALCRLVCKTGYCDPHFGNMTYEDGKLHIFDEEALGVLWDESDPNPYFVRTKEQLAMIGLQRIIDTLGHDLPVFRVVAETVLIEMQEAPIDSFKNIQAYEQFSHLIRSGSATLNDQLAAFNALDDELKYFIFHAIWRASGSPGHIDNQYGEIRFQEDPHLLLHLFNEQGLDILQQIAIRFEVKMALDVLRELKLALLDPNTSAQEIAEIIWKLQTIFQGNLLFQPIMEKLEIEELKKCQSLKKLCHNLFLDRVSNHQCLLDALIDILSEVKSDLSIPNMKERLRFAHDPIFSGKYDPMPARATTMNQIEASRLPRQLFAQKLSVLLVSYECAKFGLTYGGLGEAVYGLAKGLKESGHQVSILLPKFDKLSQTLDVPSGTITHRYQQKEKNDRVFHKNQEGIDVFYLEDTPDPNFDVVDHYSVPSAKLIYVDENAEQLPLVSGKPKYYGIKKRMAYFASAVAAFVLTANPGFSAVVYNDWHPAGALKQIQESTPISWASGKTPASILVLHNQACGCQGVYDEETAEICTEFGDSRGGKNVVLDALPIADHIVTVSPSFALEIQGTILGAGIEPHIKRVAHSGNLTGILNGSNPDLFDPSTNLVLKNWIDPVTKEPVPLNYSPNDKNIVEKKQLIREQLQKALEVYYPDHVKRFGLNFAQREYVLYVGRYDSTQKGVDMFMPIAKAAHANNLGFITMGVGEDPLATELLDTLEKEAENLRHVWITRSQGEFSINMQRGIPSQNIPALGALVRAGSAFNVVPSSFEPCGLTQFEGWLFGALALVSGTGGLKDSVCDDQKNPNFNGFIFKRMNDWNTPEQLEEAYRVAHEAFKFWNSLDTKSKAELMKKVMNRAKLSSWTTSPTGLSPVEQYERVLSVASSAKNRRNLEPIQLLEMGEIAVKDGYFGTDVNPLFESFGAQIVRNPDGETSGVTFRFMAPKAKAVSLVEKLSNSDEKITPMKSSGNGSWSLHVDHARAGMVYEYEVEQEDGLAVRKTDPFAFLVEKRPKHGSIVADPAAHPWQDSHYMAMRQKLPPLGKRPLNVYEVHLGSWKRQPNQEFLNYRELGQQLAQYCKEMSYTHVELLGILEHPSDASWGYQVSNFYAPTSRYGSVQDFQEMIDHLHQNNIGIILDFIPYHFAADDWALRNIDGPGFFEDRDPVNGQSPGWGTRVFDLRRRDVRKFLLDSARFWLEKYHIDGLRVDAVSRLVEFTEYTRKWNPNEKGSADNLGGIDFLRELNRMVHEYPGVITIAENSREGRLDTHPIESNGLGFDARWNMRMMNMELKYTRIDEDSRRNQFNRYVSEVEANANQKNISEYSHDEVVHGKGSLYSISPGNHDEKLAQTRMHLANHTLLPSYGVTTFMGIEFAQKREWNFNRGLDWDLLESQDHLNVQIMSKKLNKFYLQSPELWGSGENLKDFEWIVRDPQHLVLGYHRFGSGGQIAVICNFSKTFFRDHQITFENPRSIEHLKNVKVVFHSAHDQEMHPKVLTSNDRPTGVSLDLDPYSTVVLREELV